MEKIYRRPRYVKIYFLYEVGLDIPRYVGQTSQKPSARLAFHVSGSRRVRQHHIDFSRDQKWVSGVIADGSKIGIKLIQVVPYNNREVAENYWIIRLLASGYPLLNRRIAGIETEQAVPESAPGTPLLSFSSEQRFSWETWTYLQARLHGGSVPVEYRRSRIHRELDRTWAHLELYHSWHPYH